MTWQWPAFAFFDVALYAFHDHLTIKEDIRKNSIRIIINRESKNKRLPSNKFVALPVVVVIRLEASSSDSRKLVISNSELMTDEVS